MVGAYLRKSNEDKESDSIENQRKIVTDYAFANGLSVDEFYIDPKTSGFIVDESLAFFDREHYNRMITDLKNGKLEMVLIKDHTRLGRHAGPLLVAIELFHNFGCRLIDCTHRREIQPGDIRNHLDAMFGEHYVKDISDKVRSSLGTKQKDGTLVMNNTYGYMKKNKNRLFVDEEIRPCIELIFNKYLSGMGYQKVARYLNEHTHFPTPSQYHYHKKTENGRTYNQSINDTWQEYHIRSILSNETYTGTLVTHKTQSQGVHGKTVKTSTKDRYYFPDHHEAIIPREMFATVQQIRHKRSNHDYRGSSGHEYIFSGFCVCPDCGGNISGRTISRKAGRIPTYNCGNYTRAGRSGCTNKEMREEELLAQFTSFLISIRNGYAGFLSSVHIEARPNRDGEMLKDLNQKHERAKRELATLIMQKIKAISAEPDVSRSVIEDGYADAERGLKHRIMKLASAIDAIEKTASTSIEEHPESALDHMDSIISSPRPDRRLLEALLDKIIIHTGRVAEFVLKVDIMEAINHPSPMH